MHHLLEQAISIALTAHKGQVDKGGHPYILHPLRLMHSVDTIEEKIVALLHDVVEDSDMTFEQLRQVGFNEHILTAIEVLTKSENISYENYIEKIKNNSIATVVKKADLLDNMDTARLNILCHEDSKRLTKYENAYKYLNSK